MSNLSHAEPLDSDSEHSEAAREPRTTVELATKAKTLKAEVKLLAEETLILRAQARTIRAELATALSSPSGGLTRSRIPRSCRKVDSHTNGGM